MLRAHNMWKKRILLTVARLQRQGKTALGIAREPAAIYVRSAAHHDAHFGRKSSLEWTPRSVDEAAAPLSAIG